MHVSYTNCLVLLVGYLNSMPSLCIHGNNEIYVTVLRFNFESNVMEEYRVIINDQHAKRIVFSGFPGIPVSISGQLRNKNNPEIVADKVEFIYYPGGNELQTGFLFDFEKKNISLHTEKLDLKYQRLFDHAVKNPYTSIH